MSVMMEGSLFSSTWRSPNRAECNSSTSCGGGHRILLFSSEILVNGPLPRAPGRRSKHSKRQSEPWAPTGGLTWQHSIQLHTACKYLCHELDNTGHRSKMREFISESLQKWEKREKKTQEDSWEWNRFNTEKLNQVAFNFSFLTSVSFASESVISASRV